MWKIFATEDEKTLKSGFQNEEAAREWLETKDNLTYENYSFAEMDEEEEELFLEALESGELDMTDDNDADFEKAVEGDMKNLDYSSDDDDDNYNPDDIMLNEFEPDID